MSKYNVPTFKLNDGNEIPVIGFGTYQIPADGSTYETVKSALDAGYRHVDTAAAYFNEEEVGKAIKDSGIPRDQIWVTSKMWLQDYKYEDAKKAIETSLKKLGLDYIDLYLLHQPYGAVDEAWKAVEEARKAGKIRSIGVSNMTPKLWNKLNLTHTSNKENSDQSLIRITSVLKRGHHLVKEMLIYSMNQSSLQLQKNTVRTLVK